MISRRFVAAAKEVAAKSCGIGKHRNYKVGAILFDKKKIIKAKPNSYKTHPVLANFSEFPFQHAETACVISHGLDNCSDLSLLVVRVLKDNSITMAKPCPCCEAILQLSNIKNVFYSNWEGDIERL